MARTLSRRKLIAGAAGSLAAVAGPRSAHAQAAKPNILFIIADDLGYADISLYGQRDYTTPNIDRIGIEGKRFTQAYSNSASCSPTRTALITGRYQMRLRVGLEEPLNDQAAPGIGLPPEHPTLPSLLRKQGYKTTLIGKWHLGFLPDFSPLRSGYDKFFGIFGGSADYFNHHSKSPVPLFEDEVPVDRVGYMTNLLGDRAVQTIESYAKAKNPFLLSLHFTAPHWPWEGPGDEDESKRINGAIRHYDGGTRKTYATMVQSLDSNIGRVLQALDVNGLSENTIVIFTSDNGGERFSFNWPFSGMKSELLEGGLRIPAMVRWPGRVAANSVSDQVIISMDWFPTLLAAAGSAPEPSLPPDGESFLPILLDQAQPHPRKLYWRYKAGSQKALREGNWKYLHMAGNEFLFDVVQDPRERANLKDRHKQVFERLRADWHAWNAQMLQEKPQPVNYTNAGSLLADHYGVTNPPPPHFGGPPAK